MRRFLLALLLSLGIAAPAIAAENSNAQWRVTAQTATLAAASVTGANLAAANTILTLSADKSICIVTNSLNADVNLAYNALDLLWLPAGASLVIDLRPANLKFASSKVIAVYRDGTPTSGKIGVSCL